MSTTETALVREFFQSPKGQQLLTEHRESLERQNQQRRQVLAREVAEIVSRNAKEAPILHKRFMEADEALEKARAALKQAEQGRARAMLELQGAGNKYERQLRAKRDELRTLASPRFEEFLAEVVAQWESFRQGQPLFGRTKDQVASLGFRFLIKLVHDLANHVRDLQEDGSITDAEAEIARARDAFQAHFLAICATHDVGRVKALKDADRRAYEVDHQRTGKEPYRFTPTPPERAA